MASQHGAIIDALETLIAGILTGETIYKRVVAADRSISLSTGTHVILAPASDRYVEGTSGKQAWEYGTTIAILRAANQALAIDDTLLEVRQIIRQRLHRRPLTGAGITEAVKMVVEPGPVVMVEQWEARNILVSVLTVYVQSWEADT